MIFQNMFYFEYFREFISFERGLKCTVEKKKLLKFCGLFFSSPGSV